jgi:hypothetical protein
VEILMRTKTAVLAATVALMVACDTTEPRVPTSVEVDQQTVAMEVGETVTVVATVLDQHGRAYDTPPAGFEIAWTTTQAGVATVTDGEIRGVGSGTATIRASAGALPPAEIQVSVQARTATAQIAFSYSGHRTGTFSVVSTFRLDNVPWNDDWALTVFNLEYEDQDIIAQRRRTDGLYDFIWFWVDGQVTTPGTRLVDAGILMLGFDPATDAAEAVYFVASGSVNFTTATPLTLAGTFTLAMVEEETTEALNVTGGAFDLPVAADADVFGDPVSVDGVAARRVPSALLDVIRREMESRR